MIYEKISLDERLNRLESGNASSPQFARKIIDDFCNTPVIPALESIGAFNERQKLCELMENEYLNKAYNCADNPTFYDIATIIAKYYLKYGNTSPNAVQALNCKIKELIAIYFMFFEAVTVAIHRDKVRRNSLKSFLLSMYDFLHVSFDDYYSYIEQSVDDYNKCNCTKYLDKIDVYRKKSGVSSNMSLLMIYDELKESAWGYDSSPFEVSKSEALDIKECETFINFFIIPIVLIISINKINFKGDTDNEE